MTTATADETDAEIIEEFEKLMALKGLDYVSAVYFHQYVSAIARKQAREIVNEELRRRNVLDVTTEAT